jgi:hypothetical protein
MTVDLRLVGRARVDSREEVREAVSTGSLVVRGGMADRFTLPEGKQLDRIATL